MMFFKILNLVILGTEEFESLGSWIRDESRTSKGISIDRR
jgi:hypothetical protein